MFGLLNNTIQSRQNLVSNGNFRKWQNGAGPFTAAYAETADGWFKTGGTVERVNINNLQVNSQYGLRMFNSNLTDILALTARLGDVNYGQGKVVTISFKAKCTNAGETSTLRRLRIYRNYGTGGSATDYDNFASDLAITDQLQEFRFSGILSSTIGKTIGADNYCYLFIYTKESGFSEMQNIEFYDVKVEIGSGATLAEENRFLQDFMNHRLTVDKEIDDQIRTPANQTYIGDEINEYFRSNQIWGTSGYLQLPIINSAGGRITFCFQWGRTGAVAGNAQASVTFPLAFVAVAGCLAQKVQASAVDDSCNLDAVPTNSGMVIQNSATAATEMIWIAWGSLT